MAGRQKKKRSSRKTGFSSIAIYYVEDNLALELYVRAAYPDPEQKTITGMDQIFEIVGKLADDKLELIDYGEAEQRRQASAGLRRG